MLFLALALKKADQSAVNQRIHMYIHTCIYKSQPMGYQEASRSLGMRLVTWLVAMCCLLHGLTHSGKFDLVLFYEHYYEHKVVV